MGCSVGTGGGARGETQKARSCCTGGVDRARGALVVPGKEGAVALLPEASPLPASRKEERDPLVRGGGVGRDQQKRSLSPRKLFHHVCPLFRPGRPRRRHNLRRRRPRHPEPLRRDRRGVGGGAREGELAGSPRRVHAVRARHLSAQDIGRSVFVSRFPNENELPYLSCTLSSFSWLLPSREK